MTGVFLTYNIDNFSKKDFRSNFSQIKYKNTISSRISKVFVGKVSSIDTNKIYTKDSVSIIFAGHFFTGEFVDEEPEKYIHQQYITDNLESLYHTNGQFVFILYDKDNKTVILMNDRFGHYRTFIYLNQDENKLVISPRIKPIIKTCKTKFEIDKISVSELFQFGYILNEKTPIKGIKQLQPHSMIKINLEDLSSKIQRYYSFNYNSVFEKTFDEKVQIFGKLWDNSLHKKIKHIENICIPISGGMDSRAILGTSMKYVDSENLSCFTFGMKGSYDYEIPKQILKNYNLRHKLAEAHKTNFEDEFLLSFLDTEGMIDSTPYFPPTKYLRISAKHLFTGMMIDVFFGRHVLSKDFKRNFFRGQISSQFTNKINTIEDYKEIQDMIFKVNTTNNSSLIKKLFNNDKLELVTDFLFTHPNLDTVIRKRYPDYFAEWDFYNRQYKYIPYMVKKFDNEFDYLTMLDYELVDFSLKLSLEERLDQIFYRRALKQLLPEFFSYPLKSNFNLNIIPNPLSLLLMKNAERTKAVVNKLCKFLFHRNVFQDKHLNYQNYKEVYDKNESYRNFVNRYITRAKHRKIYNNDIIDDLVISNPGLIGPIITLEMIHEYYEI